MPSSFLDQLPSRTAFYLGAVSAVLILGTLGFVWLGSAVLRGNAITLGAEGGIAPTPTQVAPTAAAPSQAATIAVSSIPKVTDKDWIRGDKNAPVTIVEYSDYQCPFCSRFHPTMLEIMDKYEGKVRWVYRHFPLSIHPEATPSAEAAECAGEQGKFWEYSDKLFENQSKLAAGYYPQLATELGLNKSKFEDCMASDKYVSKVTEQMQGGSQAGVSGTPGSFVYGDGDQALVVRGALPTASVTAMVEQMLK